MARRTYDAVVAIFIQFLTPEEREPVFAGMRAAVRPGGLFVLEGYRPEQVDYGTGGPGRREHMYTEAWLRAGFADWDCSTSPRPTRNSPKVRATPDDPR